MQNKNIFISLHLIDSLAHLRFYTITYKKSNEPNGNQTTCELHKEDAEKTLHFENSNEVKYNAWHEPNSNNIFQSYELKDLCIKSESSGFISPNKYHIVR